MTVSVSSPSDRNVAPARASQLRVKVDMSWTSEEDDLVRRHFLDRPKLRALLPHRTRHAINTRVNVLGLNLDRQYTVIGSKDAVRIAQLAKTCRTYQEVADALGLSRQAVRSHMIRRRIHFAIVAPVSTGVPLVDAIRQRAFEMKLPLIDLDRSLGYRSQHFSRSVRAPRITIGQIAKAVEALGGRLVAVWDDE